MDKIKRFFNDEEGALAVEYVIITGLIALAIFTAAGLLGTQLSDELNEVKDEVAKITPVNVS